MQHFQRELGPEEHMLTSIHIQNFMIVDQLTVDFKKGFNVLTGETGAGKSIWIDAIALALGQRGEPSFIRTGQKRCIVTLCFDIRQHETAAEWLREHDFIVEDECLIRRILDRDQPSRSTINGAPCPQHLIREFANSLIMIHGQHQNQALLKRNQHQIQLDHFANHPSLLAEIQNIYNQWNIIAKQIHLLQNQLHSRESELPLLQHQLQEIQSLNLQSGEWQILSQQHREFHQAKDLIATLHQTLDMVSENEKKSAVSLLEQISANVEYLCSKNAKFTTAKELINTTMINLQEASNELLQLQKQWDLDPEKLAQIEERLATIHEIARKHRIQPETLSEIEQTLSQRIFEFENIETQIETLKNQQKTFLEQYNQKTKLLTEKRTKAAKKLNSLMTGLMQELGMNGEFRVHFIAQEKTPHPLGNEQIEFDVKTNPGQDFSPLQKIVSGGELSRISLALQTLIAKNEGVPTLIFDEVDTGIGGKTAHQIGKMLRELGENLQVLCITHLPQVAARGHSHYKVEKNIQKDQVQTQMRLLASEERIHEIARMLSGEAVTDQTLAHAAELLEQ